MEFEGLFSSTRWEILNLLSENPLAPMELSEALKTTSANISQQLRLLELAGLVKSERTRESDKNKPRIIYSLADDFSYLIMASTGFSDKKLVPLGNYHNYVLKSMFIKNPDFHRIVGKLFWDLEDCLNDIDKVIVDQSSAIIKIIVVADKKFHSSLDKVMKKSEFYKEGFKYAIAFEDKFSKKSAAEAVVLYDHDAKKIRGGVK